MARFNDPGWAGSPVFLRVHRDPEGQAVSLERLDPHGVEVLYTRNGDLVGYRIEGTVGLHRPDDVLVSRA